MSRHLDRRASLRSHPCPQRWGGVPCPLMSAGLLPGGTERGTVGKEPGFLAPGRSGIISHWPAPHTHHQLPHPGARHPRLLPLTPPRLAVRPWKSPFPSVTSLSTGDICNNHSTWSKVSGSPEPPRVCWEPRRVPTPGRSESSRGPENRDRKGQWVGVGMSFDMWRLKELCFQT